MKWLLDTNILLRWAQPKHSLYLNAIQALEILHNQGEQLFITAQNIIEFWAVATRSIENNGLGMSTSITALKARELESFFPLLPDTAEVYRQWYRLVNMHTVQGMLVHDARLVAVMMAHQVSHLLTFNARDFQRYHEITVLKPSEVLNLNG